MALRHPNWPKRFNDATIVNLAQLGPVGAKLPAPGTWGSVLGLLYFTLFFYHLNPAALILLSAAAAYIAVGICGEAEIRLGKRDPGSIILDEFVAMPLCFVAWPYLKDIGTSTLLPNWIVFLAGFLVFRLFDILKPFGISTLQNLPRGWGVVADDIGAAIATCATLHIIRAICLFLA